MRYHEPQWVRKRIEGQLQLLSSSIERMQQRLAEGDILSAQRSHVYAVKRLLGIPRAVLNRRCTMARGVLFCREASSELGWSSYVPEVVTILGVAGITETDVADLQSIATQIIAASTLTDDEKIIRRRHLQSSHWLLENAQAADAVWPLYFWSRMTVEDCGGHEDPLLWEHWLRFSAMIGVGDRQRLLDKAEQAHRLLDWATALGLTAI